MGIARKIFIPSSMNYFQGDAPEGVQGARGFAPFKPPAASLTKMVQGCAFLARNKVQLLPRGLTVAPWNPSGKHLLGDIFVLDDVSSQRA